MFEIFLASVIVAPIQPIKHEIDCIAAAINHEARGEPPQGKASIGWVIINRMKHPDYPKTACGVVYQPKQFSGIQKPGKFTEKDRQLAKNIYLSYGSIPHYMKDVTHFHATYVSPGWQGKLQKVIQIGNHIFYKNKKT